MTMIQKINMIDHNEVSYHATVNRYGMSVDVHDVPPEVFKSLPGKHDGVDDSTRWCSIELPGLKVTYFKEMP